MRRYNLSTDVLETGYNLGGSLNGADITPDDSFLLVAQNNTNGSQGTFHKLNLLTGAVTNINYPSSAGGGWDVAIASNGLAMVTTSGSSLRQINLSTNTISVRTDAPGSLGDNHLLSGNTQIHHSADGSRLFFLEPLYPRTHAFTYAAATNSFGPTVNSWNDFRYASAAVNRNGTLLGTLLNVQFTPPPNPEVALDTAPDFQFVRAILWLMNGTTIMSGVYLPSASLPWDIRNH